MEVCIYNSNLFSKTENFESKICDFLKSSQIYHTAWLQNSEYINTYLWIWSCWHFRSLLQLATRRHVSVPSLAMPPLRLSMLIFSTADVISLFLGAYRPSCVWILYVCIFVAHINCHCHQSMVSYTLYICETLKKLPCNRESDVTWVYCHGIAGSVARWIGAITAAVAATSFVCLSATMKDIARLKGSHTKHNTHTPTRAHFCSVCAHVWRGLTVQVASATNVACS